MRSIHKAKGWFLGVATVLVCASTGAQQTADPDFNPSVAHPAYVSGGGPVVMIDEAHFNFHTAGARYRPFADLLRLDGYRVQALTQTFSASSLKECSVLVIANALPQQRMVDVRLPIPSAFTDQEIASLLQWVKEGGALFLIVDHMPMPGAAEKLAEAFGVKWSNGYAIDSASEDVIVFKRTDNSLADHPITNGRNSAERIESVATFTGSAFQAPAAKALLTFEGNVTSFMTEKVGEFKPDTPTLDVSRWQQGAVMNFGRGRVALFGEAAMFTAQLAGPERQRVGMNAPIAPQNSQFLLNVLHWLSGLLNETDRQGRPLN